MTDQIKIDVALGQLVRHTDRLATAAERIASALEKAIAPPMQFIQRQYGDVQEIVRVEPSRPSSPFPPEPNPYGVDTW